MVTVTVTVTADGTPAAAELAEMRNKIRLLQGEAPAGLTEAPGGPLPEGAPVDSPASSQTGQEDEEDQSSTSPQRRRFRSCAGLAFIMLLPAVSI